jgi:hypothetical protein
LNVATSIIGPSNNVVATSSSYAMVNLAAITITGTAVSVLNGQAVGTVGTLSDAAGVFATGNYFGTLSCPQIPYPCPLYFTPSGNNDGTYSVQAGSVPALPPGQYQATLNAWEYNPTHSQMVTSVAQLTINVSGATGIAVSSTGSNSNLVQTTVNGIVTFNVVVSGYFTQQETVNVSQDNSQFTGMAETADSWNGTPCTSETLTYQATGMTPGDEPPGMTIRS